MPSPAEIDNRAAWLRAEIDLLIPGLILPVGKPAISRLLPVKKLNDVIGKLHPPLFTATAPKRSRYRTRPAHQPGTGD